MWKNVNDFESNGWHKQTNTRTINQTKNKQRRTFQAKQQVMRCLESAGYTKYNVVYMGTWNKGLNAPVATISTVMSNRSFESSHAGWMPIIASKCVHKYRHYEQDSTDRSRKQPYIRVQFFSYDRLCAHVRSIQVTKHSQQPQVKWWKQKWNIAFTLGLSYYSTRRPFVQDLHALTKFVLSVPFLADKIINIFQKSGFWHVCCLATSQPKDCLPIVKKMTASDNMYFLTGYSAFIFHISLWLKCFSTFTLFRRQRLNILLRHSLRWILVRLWELSTLNELNPEFILKHRFTSIQSIVGAAVVQHFAFLVCGPEIFASVNILSCSIYLWYS